jgi:hypothetical protein
MPPPYVLDTNIFIEAKQRYYAFDLCPGFWDALVWQQGRGCVCSVDRVKAELALMADELHDWATNVMPEQCFLSTDAEDVLAKYAAAIQWVHAQPQFTAEAKAEFARQQNADAWVIAYAGARGATVVTHETAKPDARRRVPIPNVCNALGVPHLNTFEMMRDLTVALSWVPGAAIPIIEGPPAGV